MATRVDRWIARDGREFQTEASCEAHDKWLCLLDWSAMSVEDRQAFSRVYGIVKSLLKDGTLVLGEKAAAYYAERTARERLNG